MNLPKKLFCRGFQTVLRAALPLLPYRDPKILNRVEEIPDCLNAKKIRKVLIVTDGFLHISGMLEPMKKALSAAGIGYVVYDEVTPNPTILNVELARERYLAENCESLIGFGGGSAIDCAKAVGARIARPKLTIPKRLPIPWADSITFPMALPTPYCFPMCWKPTVPALTGNIRILPLP